MRDIRGSAGVRALIGAEKPRELHGDNPLRRHTDNMYTFLRDELGATFIQYIPIIERATEQSLPIADAGWGGAVKERPLYAQEGNLVTHRSVGPGQYGRFLIDVFEEWVRRDIGTVYVQMFDTALANLHGEPGGMCVHAKTRGLQLALEHTGDLYSCDHYVEPGYLLGNIKNTHLLELVASPAQRRFGQDKRDTLTRYCRDCDVRFACNGGCPNDRFATSPTANPASTTCAPATRRSSTTSASRWKPGASSCGRTGLPPSS